jgi:hypothetical protein
VKTEQPRVILESHYYFTCKAYRDPPSQGELKRACGPYFGVVTGQDDLLAGVSAGWIFGWKARDAAKGSGFSIGIGALLEGDVTSLGDGFEENEPPPPGEDTVRYKTEPRLSVLLFFTRTF